MCLIAQRTTHAGSPISRRLRRGTAPRNKITVPGDTLIFVVGSYLKGAGYKMDNYGNILGKHYVNPLLNT
jgi:hypothetical protein